MEPSCTQALPAPPRAVRPVSGPLSGALCPAVAAGSGHGMGSMGTDAEVGDPPSADVPPRSAWRQAPLFFAVSGPTTGQAFWLLVFALSAAALYWLSLRQKKLEAANPDPWSLPRAVDHTLILAMDRRAHFHVAVLPPPSHAPARSGKARPFPLAGMDGTCVQLDRRTLTLQLDIALPGRELAAWVGRDVRAEFSVTVENERRFFRFDSVVLRGMADAARPLLELARPLRLEPHQRRAFPRVAAMAADVAALGVWPLEENQAPCLPARRHGAGPEPASAPPGFPCHLPADPATLPAPLLLFRPGASTTARLTDISASGLGLRLKKNAVPPLTDCWLVFLCLRTPGNSPLLLWLACERRHLSPSPTRPMAVLGLAIRQWGQVPGTETLIPWKSTAPDGSVPPLLRWVLRRRTADRRPRCFNL